MRPPLRMSPRSGLRAFCSPHVRIVRTPRKQSAYKRDLLFLFASVSLLAFPALALGQTGDESWKIDVQRAGLTSLAECESHMNPAAYHPHDGKSGSFGLFQWKIASFYYYNRLYNV